MNFKELMEKLESLQDTFEKRSLVVEFLKEMENRQQLSAEKILKIIPHLVLKAKEVTLIPDTFSPCEVLTYDNESHNIAQKFTAEVYLKLFDVDKEKTIAFIKQNDISQDVVQSLVAHGSAKLVSTVFARETHRQCYSLQKLLNIADNLFKLNEVDIAKIAREEYGLEESSQMTSAQLIKSPDYKTREEAKYRFIFSLIAESPHWQNQLAQAFRDSDKYVRQDKSADYSVISFMMYHGHYMSRFELAKLLDVLDGTSNTHRVYQSQTRQYTESTVSMKALFFQYATMHQYALAMARHYSHENLSWVFNNSPLDATRDTLMEYTSKHNKAWCLALLNTPSQFDKVSDVACQRMLWSGDAEVKAAVVKAYFHKRSRLDKIDPKSGVIPRLLTHCDAEQFRTLLQKPAIRAALTSYSVKSFLMDKDNVVKANSTYLYPDLLRKLQPKDLLALYQGQYFPANAESQAKAFEKVLAFEEVRARFYGADLLAGIQANLITPKQFELILKTEGMISNEQGHLKISGERLQAFHAYPKYFNIAMSIPALQERWLVEEIFDPKWNTMGVGFMFLSRKTPTNILKMRELLGNNKHQVSFPLDGALFETLIETATNALSNCMSCHFFRSTITSDFYKELTNLSHTI